MEASLNAVELREIGARGKPSSAGPSSQAPAPWTGGTTRGFENASYIQDEEEPNEPRQGTNVTKDRLAQPPRPGPSATNGKGDHLSGCSGGEEEAGLHHQEIQELTEYRVEDHSADYGFILALVFLVSGIVLVVIAYTIPREAKVDLDTVSARQMERLELFYAQLGSHLDRCIIAGLGLLTLGGMLLSVLLMVSICRGEAERGRAFVRPKRTYGSVNLRMKQLAGGEGEGEGGGERRLVEREADEAKADSKPEAGTSGNHPSSSSAAHGVN